MLSHGIVGEVSTLAPNRMPEMLHAQDVQLSTHKMPVECPHKLHSYICNVILSNSQAAHGMHDEHTPFPWTALHSAQGSKNKNLYEMPTSHLLPPYLPLRVAKELTTTWHVQHASRKMYMNIFEWPTIFKFCTDHLNVCTDLHIFHLQTVPFHP